MNLEEFKIGMKLEVVDKYNPSLIRVATVIDVNESQIKIHYDNWFEAYDFWCDKDSEDIHPINWCKKTGHPLTKPPVLISNTSGCPTVGCNGIGHRKGSKFETHYR